MICQMINSQRDPFLKEKRVSLLEMVQNPSRKKKEDLEQWMFIDLIDPIQIRRNLLNYNNCHALIIEFDNKDRFQVTIEQFTARYKHLAWILHTTSSHTKALHKFRVILPLDVPTAYSTWHSRCVRDEMEQYFIGIDPSSFSNFQKIPALPANPDDYQYVVNQGAKFSYVMIKDNVEVRLKLDAERRAESDRWRESRCKSDTINYEAYKAKVDESMEELIGYLPTSANGNRYNSFCSVMGKMLNCRYPDGTEVYDASDVKNMLQFKYWDNSLEKALRSFSRRRR